MVFGCIQLLYIKMPIINKESMWHYESKRKISTDITAPYTFYIYTCLKEPVSFCFWLIPNRNDTLSKYRKERKISNNFEPSNKKGRIHRIDTVMQNLQQASISFSLPSTSFFMSIRVLAHFAERCCSLSEMHRCLDLALLITRSHLFCAIPIEQHFRTFIWCTFETEFCVRSCWFWLQSPKSHTPTVKNAVQ